MSVVVLSFHSSVMATSAPSTPSRKRSKWAADDSEDDPTPPVVKRRPKVPRYLRTSDIAQLEEPSRSVSPESVSSSSKRPPLHSAFVPPRTRHPPIVSSRSVYSYERLNSIEEGSYGIVFRAKDKLSGDVVAIKKLKLDEEKHGFPITALREINSLMNARHENVVRIREVVVGETLTQYVLWSTLNRGYTVSPFVGLFACSSHRKGVYRHGLHRARPQDAPHAHAPAVPAVRNQDAHAPAALCRRTLPRKLDPPP
jgi:hypothetical protein